MGRNGTSSSDDIEIIVVHQPLPPRHSGSAVYPQPSVPVPSSSPHPQAPRLREPWFLYPRLGGQVPPRRRWASWLVPVFAVANVVLFVVTMYYNDCPRQAESPRRCIGRGLLGRFAFQPLRQNIMLGPSVTMLEKMGALNVHKVVHNHQGWRLFSCIWLHAGVLHIFTNVFGLLIIGIPFEKEFGFVRIGLLYLISGFGGSLMSALFIKSRISVGASGAIFGLLGGALSEILTNWTIYSEKRIALVVLVITIGVSLAFGFLPHMDNFAHLGGLLTGFLLGFMVLIRPQFGWVSQHNAPQGNYAGSARRKHNSYQYIMCTIATILLIAWFTVGLVTLYRHVDANDQNS